MSHRANIRATARMSVNVSERALEVGSRLTIL